MEILLTKIGYNPRNTKEDNEENVYEDEMLDNIAVKDNAGFTPQYKKLAPPSGPEPFTGITIRNLPLNVTVGDLKQLLEENDVKADDIVVNKRKYKHTSAADIDGISDSCCKKLINPISYGMKQQFLKMFSSIDAHRNVQTE